MIFFLVFLNFFSFDLFISNYLYATEMSNDNFF